MLLSLVCNAVFGGSGGGVACGATDPIAAPVTPCGVYVNSTTGQIFWYFNGQWNPPSGGGSALAWGNRVVANGAAMPSAGTLSAVSTFLTSTSSLTSRIWHMNIIAPDSLIAMRTPLINTFGADPWVPHTVGAGFAETIDVTGWQGCTDGVNAIVYDCGVNPSLVTNFTTGNGGLSVLVVGTNPTNADLVGCSSGPQNFFMQARGTVNSSTSIWSAATSATVATPGFGFYSASRTSTTALNLYFATSVVPWSSIKSSAVNEATGPTNEVAAVGGQKAFGTYTPCAQKISFLAIHDGFSSADGQILYNAVQAFRVAIGGGFV